MSSINVDELSLALESTRVSPSGVTFAGKGLKLDSEKDAKPVVEEIDKCTDLQYLNLEGNTLGVEASKAIAKALEKHPEFKRALWKDMFTGRMKTEIPKALEFLGAGLVAAGARLTELDMSDNAFGPIGVQGLAALLKSPSCHCLEELRLNNNGLGITGGKLLASALTDCYNRSQKEGRPLALKVFIAGRNRLENEGSAALAQFFKMIGTLEEVQMPQNGIYHVGITALADAFAQNKYLQIINLNDNTMGVKGAEAIAKALPNLQNLKLINFGDCLLKTKGAISVAKALRDQHQHLEELILDSNEIRVSGGLELAKAIANKEHMKNLLLNSNEFGERGREELETELKLVGKLNVLGSLSDDESEDGEGDECSESEESEPEDEASSKTNCSVQKFLDKTTAENLMAMGDDRNSLFLSEVRGDHNIVDCVVVIMKVAQFSTHPEQQVAETAQTCAEKLSKELYIWAQNTDMVSLVTNVILVQMGLIKSEDKFKPPWSVDGCVTAFKKIVKKPFVPISAKETLKFFLDKNA